MQAEKTPRPTGMAVAFYMALISACDDVTKTGEVPRLVGQVQGSINRNVGLVRERTVDAKVSFKTAQKLKQQGVL